MIDESEFSEIELTKDSSTKPIYFKVMIKELQKQEKPEENKEKQNSFSIIKKKNAYFFNSVQFLEKKEKLDLLEGKILSNKVYPIYYITFTENDSDLVKIKTISYVSNLSNEQILEILNSQNRDNFLYFFRDICFDYNLNESSYDKDKIDIINKISNLLDYDMKEFRKIRNLEISPFPTKNKKLLRYFPLNQTTLDLYIKENLYLINFKDPNIKAVENYHIVAYCDPCDFSYHNFENIINLDFFIKNEKSPQISNFKTLNKGIYTLNFKGIDNLLELDQMNLYNLPFNSSQRGGKRFIFSSENLSKCLTNSINDLIKDSKNKNSSNSDFFELMNSSFEFVNYVFRYNNFLPEDKKFSMHYDTPYYNKYKNQISKYTLIVYLTGGKADDYVLKFKGDKEENDVVIKDISVEDGFYCVIFDHSYEHEGKPFINGEKIFLRSEIIVNYLNNKDIISYDIGEAALFNSACYFSLQSLFIEELNAYNNELFNQSTKSKLNKLNSGVVSFKYLHKNFPGINFITNGNDYYFPNNLNLHTMALLILIDYFNATINQKDLTQLVYSNFVNNNVSDVNYNSSELVFNKITKTRILDNVFSSNECILKLLNEIQSKEIELFNSELLLRHSIPLTYDYRSDCNEDQCCPRHNNTNEKPFIPVTNTKVINHMNYEIYKENKRVVNNFCIGIFGEKVVVDFNSLKVDEGKIYFEKMKIPQICFAGCDTEEPACWEGENENAYISKENKYFNCLVNVPPIYYTKYNEGYHFRLDIFNNTYILSKVEEYKSISVYTGETKGNTVDVNFVNPNYS